MEKYGRMYKEELGGAKKGSIYKEELGSSKIMQILYGRVRQSWSHGPLAMKGLVISNNWG